MHPARSVSRPRPGSPEPRRTRNRNSPPPDRPPLHPHRSASCIVSWLASTILRATKNSTSRLGTGQSIHHGYVHCDAMSWTVLPTLWGKNVGGRGRDTGSGRRRSGVFLKTWRVLRVQISYETLLPVAFSLLIHLADELFELRLLFLSQNRAYALAPPLSGFIKLRLQRLSGGLSLRVHTCD